jgi:DNA repair photolyase
MKDMSESFWREHEPVVYQFRDELVQKVQHFGNRIRGKLGKKFDKWAKKAKKWHNRDSEADNRREDFKGMCINHLFKGI